MAEDLQKRMHFGDSGLCLGAVAKLCSLVVAQKKKIAQSSCISSQSPQILELKILWEQCTVASDTISTACSEALVSLVRDGHADFSYVMKGLLNVIPSAVNTSGPLQALRQLLVLEINACLASDGVYRCPYGLRYPPHPLISALNSRPDCWPMMLQQVSKALGTTDDRYRGCVVPMLRPFLTYVLLNPTLPPQLVPFKTLLTDTLLRAGASADPAPPGEKDAVSAAICRFLLDCLRQVKITSIHELSEVVSQVISLSETVLTNNTADASLLRSLSMVAMTLCKDCLTFGHDLTPCLKILNQMIPSYGVDAMDKNLTCLLSLLMLEAPVYQLKELLSVAEKVVNAYEQEVTEYDPTLKMLIFPLLRVISTPVYASVTVETRERSANQRRASQLLSAVTRLVRRGRVDRTQLSKDEALSEPTLNGWYRLMESCCHLATLLASSPAAAASWLTSLRSVLASTGKVSSPTMLLLASLLWDQPRSVVLAALEALTAVAGQDASWAPSLLPLLLHRLGQESDPVVTFDLLCALPQTATHKVCATGVLRTLQSLAAGDTALAPLTLRLTTQLWKLQDRSFPHLQKLLLHPARVSPDCDDETQELLLAKVASIRDVCMLRPHRGADLLPVLSKLLDDCSGARQASIAAMALDALHALCQAEVVDLRTMWAVLAPKLANDQRPLVIQSVCKLLGSAPALLADTQNFEEFCDEVVDLMWQYSSHGNPAVSAAAFTALANFSEEDFTLDDIPPEFSQEERAKIESARAKQKESGDKTGQDEDEVEEDEYQPVPPSCYMKLLMHVNQEVLPAYQVFLSSLLVEEIKNLPRGTYKLTLRGQQQLSGRGKAFDGIPSLLLNRYERTKKPALKPGLSVGLLFCFEPKRETSHRDDKPARRHVVSKGRAYQHIINALINEVSIEPSDWFGCLQQPQAWTTLMQNAFQSLVQSRRAELELQQSHGHLNESPADFQSKINSAWLWVRDKLTDQLKIATKSTSLAQANSVLALASLAVVSTHHFVSLEEAEDTAPGSWHQPSQHAGQHHWLGVVIDTLLCLLDDQYQTKSKIFTWYQQHQKGQSVSSVAVRSNAAVALSLLAPFLLTSDTQQLHLTLDALTQGLPGQSRSHHPSPDVQASCGVALGMLAARLFADGYTDYTGTEGEIRMMRVVDALEAASLPTSTEHSAPCGPLLGLAMALSAMSTEGAAHIKAHLVSVHRRLLVRLDGEERITPCTEALCMCIGCLTAASFHSNIISPSDAFSVAVKLQMLCQQHDQNPGLAVCTGVLFHSLVSSSHPTIDSLLTNLYSSWCTVIADQTMPVAQRMAAMYGLTGLVTGGGPLMHAATQTQTTSDMHNRSVAVTKHLTQMLSDWTDPVLQNASAFLLGYLHLVSVSASQGKTGIPSTYSYLPETSLLRTCMDQVVLAGRTGPETIPCSRLETLLSALAGQHRVLPPLPPLNWTAVLSPVMRLPYGDEVHRLCLELALSQSQRQSSAGLFLTAWLGPALFGTLKEPCKAVLCRALPTLVRAVPVSKLKPFVEMHLMEPFRACGAHTLDQCAAIVESLLGALGVPDPPQGAVLILHKAVWDIYRLMPASFQVTHGRILAQLAQCLCHLPGEDIDAITSPLAQNNLLKSTFVRSYIVCQGKQSLMWLNPCVDVAMNVADSGQHQRLVWTLLVALAQTDPSPGHQHTAAGARLHWLSELMGHTSNVARAKTRLDPNRPIHKAVQFLLDVFTAAVIAWSPTDLPLVLGTAPSWSFNVRPGEQSPGVTGPTTGFGCSDLQRHAADDLLRLLPYSLPLLLDSEPWSQITDKVLDWLLSLHEVESERLTTKTRTHLKATIVSLRHTSAFKKPLCWTRVYNS